MLEVRLKDADLRELIQGITKPIADLAVIVSVTGYEDHMGRILHGPTQEFQRFDEAVGVLLRKKY